MHAHDCPLCDQKFQCMQLGCEDDRLTVCPDCMAGLEEVPAEETMQ